jgi:hypothetical protein
MTSFKKMLFGCFLFIWSYGFNQTVTTPEIDLKSTSPSDWTEYFSADGIVISYKLASCDPEMGYDQESVLLKVQNSGVNTVVLDWHSLLSFDGVCKTCDFEEEYSTRLKLEPNTAIEGNCSIYGPREVKFFVRFNDVNYTKGEVLTSFKLDKLQITILTESNQ